MLWSIGWLHACSKVREKWSNFNWNLKRERLLKDHACSHWCFHNSYFTSKKKKLKNPFALKKERARWPCCIKQWKTLLANQKQVSIGIFSSKKNFDMQSKQRFSRTPTRFTIFCSSMKSVFCFCVVEYSNICRVRGKWHWHFSVSN